MLFAAEFHYVITQSNFCPQKANELLSKYNQASKMVNDQFSDTKSAEERARRLKERTDKLYNAVQTKKDKLGGEGLS